MSSAEPPEPAPVEHKLTFEIGQADRFGKQNVTVKLGDEPLHGDKIDVRKDADRSRYAKKVAAQCPGLEAHDVSNHLLRFADHATKGAAAGEREDAEAAPDPDAMYDVVGGCLSRTTGARDGIPFKTAMCNFDAAIVEEITRDDGVEQSRRLTIEGTLAGGEPLARIEVSTEEFARGEWPLVHWGTRAVVFAGQGNRDHLRAAIQIRSKDVSRRTVRAFTGWCKVDETWAYLHAGGAIGPFGPQESISVDLPDALKHYVLPAPPEGEDLIRSIRASIGLAHGLAPDTVVLPLLATAYRAVTSNADFSAQACGRTGIFKTALAAVMQQHWGPGMDAKNLPANFSSTGNALEALAFACKDALMVVDDFSPTGSATDVSRYHREAERLIRAQGNQSGRQRLRPDGTPKRAKPPRGVILITGEDVPKGHSLRARLLVVEVGRDDVRAGRLSECQREAAAGLYAGAMAGYVRWLAGRYEQARDEIKAEAERLRAELSEGLAGQHRRTPAMVGDLLAGFTLFLSFAREVGAIDDATQSDLESRCRAALLDVAAEQAAHQEDSDPCDRYLGLLKSVLSSGRAHVAGPDGGPPAVAPQSWGWKTDGRPTDPLAAWHDQGRRIGWVDGDDLYLDSEAAYAEAQRLANDQGDSLPINRPTLHRRLNERHLLVSTEASRKKLLVRRNLAGARHHVLHLHAARVMGLNIGGPKGPGGPNGDNPRENGPLGGASAEPGTGKRPTEEAQIPGENGASGPPGPFGPLETRHKAHPGGDHDGGPDGADADGGPEGADEEVTWTA